MARSKSNRAPTPSEQQVVVSIDWGNCQGVVIITDLGYVHTIMTDGISDMWYVVNVNS